MSFGRLTNAAKRPSTAAMFSSVRKWNPRSRWLRPRELTSGLGARKALPQARQPWVGLKQHRQCHLDRADLVGRCGEPQAFDLPAEALPYRPGVARRSGSRNTRGLPPCRRRQAVDAAKLRLVQGEPNTSKLAAIRSGVADLGMTTTSWSMCHRITT